MKTKINKYLCIIVVLLLSAFFVQADYLELQEYQKKPYLLLKSDDGASVWGFFVTLDEKKALLLEQIQNIQ